MLPHSPRTVFGLAGTLLVLLGALVLFACSQTPTPVPVRTFERAQRVDFVCLQLWEPITNPDGSAGRATVVPRGRPLADCTPTPSDRDGASLPNQLFALVTQSARGEVAVVNLSAGAILDISSKSPSSNFLPVGTVPTDIVSAPDGQMSFVASADPNKPALYALPSAMILGDKAGVIDDVTGATIPLPAEARVTPKLTSWPVCALPQAPGALSWVPRAVPAGGDAASYEIVAVLPGDRTTPARVVTIDPRPFLRGVRGAGAADAGVASDAVIAPGSLAPCPITSTVELAGEASVPAAFRPGATWQNGVPYVDGGIDLTCEVPAPSPTCGAAPCCAPKETLPSGFDGGVDASAITAQADAGACATPGDATRDGDAGAIPLDLGPLDPPRVVALARDESTLYVADEALPFVHVLDLSIAGTAVERAPLLAASLADPSRTVGVRALAVSPATREFKKFLYAVEARTGALLVYDVSQPSDAPRTPLKRPYPELNPFQPADRVLFSSPVVAVEFARTDLPIRRDDTSTTAITGALCNPNPTVPADDPGALYRSASASRGGIIDPKTLRGVFALVTLASGTVAVVDVDDWDAPCRRPAILATDLAQGGGRAFSSLAPAQPSVAGDAYGAPVSVDNSTTDEAFFPVSVPHRLRSAVLFKAAAATGKQIPYITGTPSIDRLGSSLPVAGEGSDATPILRPTLERGAELALAPGVRFSFEVPDVHVDQDWTVTFEGALPGFDGFEGTLATGDGYQSLELKQPGARFCAKGVEDWESGKVRAAEIDAALVRSGRRTPDLARFGRPTAPLEAERLDRRMADYVQLTSELLPRDDAYWTLASGTAAGSCWEGVTAAAGPARYDLCATTFGAPADESPGRDFPILEAYDDKLVLGRFYTFSADGTREVVYKDPSNEASLRLAQCCFHGETKFTVRAGAQWVTLGSAFGFLSHQIAGQGGRCEPSCDAREALLNGRAPMVTRGVDAQAVPPVSRDSALAMRNPAFSFFVENGTRRVVRKLTVVGANGQVTTRDVTVDADVPPQRNTQWRFTTRGQFQSLSLAIGGTSSTVSPQSMKFVAPLGQMAVVDAAAQGLVLIDLRTVAIARAPYF
jgi:hypothetical protein